MFPKEIIMTDDGEESLASLDKTVQRHARRAIERYAATGAGRVKRLKGSTRLSLHFFEDWRVIFYQDARTISVVYIGHRSTVYRDMA